MSGRRVAVLGGGGWGTALAQVTARAGNEVALWARDPAVVSAINTARRNPRYLSDLTLDPAVRATADLAAAITAAEAVLLAVPAQTVRGLAAALAATGAAPTTAVICAKGLEIGSGKLLSEVLGESLPGWPVAVLSGPSFAGETAAGVPTAVTVAADSLARAGDLAACFGTPSFRPYASDDVIGVEVAGAVKNVIAIAAGIAAGLGFGDNTRAALITRGLAEIARFAVALGAIPDPPAPCPSACFLSSQRQVSGGYHDYSQHLGHERAQLFRSACSCRKARPAQFLRPARGGR